MKLATAQKTRKAICFKFNDYVNRAATVDIVFKKRLASPLRFNVLLCVYLDWLDSRSSAAAAAMPVSRNFGSCPDAS